MGNITPHCQGCSKIDENENCTVYSNPAYMMRWVDNRSIKVGCSFNASKYVQVVVQKEKVRVGQQKQKQKKK
uniref:Uncharacterized protein n=1 Tax=Desulfatirhabdium butyrativorans TaxID=340467 RepID=A0A7C4RUJ3_9BACT